MRRPPGLGDARAGLWAWRALRSTRLQLQAGGMRDLRVPAPPRVGSGAARAVRVVLRIRRSSCLEQALVLQRWLAEQGVHRDVVVGTRRQDGAFAAHAWLDGDTHPSYAELTRLSP